MKTVESSRESESSDAVVTVVEFIGRSVGCKEGSIELIEWVESEASQSQVRQ